MDSCETNRDHVVRDLRYLKSYGKVSNNQTIYEIAESALELLKEQDAVEPTIDEYGNKRYGSCGHKLQSIADQDLFCCKCGKPVLWESR